MKKGHQILQRQLKFIYPNQGSFKTFLKVWWPSFVLVGVFLSSCYGNNINLPAWEKRIINEVADEYHLEGEARLLLFVIRKVENGRKGREFGVLHPAAINTTYRNQCQWAAGTIKKRFHGDLKAFADRWCPVGAENDPQGLNKNWYKNAKYYMEKWGRR